MQKLLDADRAFRRSALPLAMGLILITVGVSEAQQRLTENVTTDPFEAEFVHADVENFIRAFGLLASESDTVAILEEEYLALASPGLSMFIQKYDLTSERLLKAIRKHPEKYAGLDAILAALTENEPAFKATYAQLADMIPGAVFPPTYFLVAGHRGIGSGSTEGPLISVEKKSPESIASDLPATLVHEMVHMEQLAALGEDYFAIFSGEERTLLATSVREGVATWFSERITGGSHHKNLARDYLLAHEDELWARFQSEMLGHDMGDWLWKKPTDPGQPQDVGYALGARIAEAYYANAEDKELAVWEILAIRDYPAFVEKSGYGK